ncbi:(2Fe-2S)-binding protein, partial [Escherichia coli]
SKGDIIQAVNKGCHTVAALKAETKAGTGCGGCIPLLTQVLNAELSKQGIEVNHHLCEHFAYSRQELFHLIRVEGIKSFEALLAK